MNKLFISQNTPVGPSPYTIQFDIKQSSSAVYAVSGTTTLEFRTGVTSIAETYSTNLMEFTIPTVITKNTKSDKLPINSVEYIKMTSGVWLKNNIMVNNQNFTISFYINNTRLGGTQVTVNNGQFTMNDWAVWAQSAPLKGNDVVKVEITLD